MGTNVSLTPALELFARELVEEGRYNSVSEVVRDALRLLQDRQKQSRTLMALIREAEESVERYGTFEADDVLRELDEIIAEHEVAADAKT